MESWEQARRRYDNVKPPTSIKTTYPSSAIEDWLVNDVCAVVEEYLHRPEFQRHAAWPLENLTAGTKTPERELIESIDRMLDEAREAFLLEWTNASRAALDAADGAGARRRNKALKGTGLDPSLPARFRFWTDLVSGDDYFWPSRSGVFEEVPPSVPIGRKRPAPIAAPDASSLKSPVDFAFAIGLSPELHLMGDLVSECMWARINEILDVLETLRRGTGSRLASSKPTQEASAPRLPPIRKLMSQLKKLMAGPEASLRKGCITLVQAYAAFANDPSLDWLGKDADAVREASMLRRHFLLDPRHFDSVDTIYQSLSVLERLYEAPQGRHKSVDSAVAQRKLVVDTKEKRVYWEQRAIDQNWKRFPQLFKLITSLARRALIGASVQGKDFFEDVPAKSAFSTLRGRLKRRLPPGLAELIVTNPGDGSYQLRLASTQIRVL